MFSIYFFAWAMVSAIMFAGLHVAATARISRGTVLLAIFGFLAGWMLSLLFRPAIDPFLTDSVLLFGFLYVVATFMIYLWARGPGPMPIIVGVCLLVFSIVVIFVTTFSGFHAPRYASLITPTETTRDTSIPLIDQSQARLVTPELARKRAAELLSSSDEQGLGSRVVIGEMWGNEVGGTMYWIAPLEHSGFWRWVAADTTPGYIMVSQFNEVNARFVQDKPIKIGINAYMSDNVYRRLYMNGYINYDYSEAMFQIDEKGNPFWVVALQYPQVGLSGYMPVKWAMIDATSGEIETFENTADLPDWVDRAYPQDIIAARFDDWGCLGQGWVACAFTGRNVITSTPGISVTIDPKGDIVYYSGTQFANARSEGATSGLYLADARSGEVTFYPRAGITENAARDVLQQAYANYPGYTAAEPLLLSINGREAFFSIILDGSGVRKGFAIVAQDNRNLIGTGNSVQAAVTEFSRSIQRSGRDAGFEAGTGLGGDSVEGLVVSYTPYVQNGRTVFYISIDTLPNKILEISEEKVGEIVVTQVGDPVKVTSDNFLPGVIYVTGFDNLRVQLEEEGIQPIVDAEMQGATERYRANVEKRNAAAILEDISDEELDALMEALRAKARGR